MTGAGMDANSAYGRCPSMALMDAVAAINAAVAVVTALRRRKATGQGAFVEMVARIQRIIWRPLACRT